MMAACTVFLAHVDLIRRQTKHRLQLAIADARTPVLWLFLAEDFRSLQLWEKELGLGCERMEMGPLLDRTADELRLPFIAWVDSLSARYGSDPHWWLTHISERNTTISPLFLFVCYLGVVRKVLSEGPRPHLIVAQSWGLIDALLVLGRTLGLKFRVLSRLRKHVQIGNEFFQIVESWGRFLVGAIRNEVAARRTRRGRPVFSSGPRRILFDTFFDESSALPDGLYRDRFFPFLLEWLAAQGMEVWILPTVLTGRRSIGEKYRWMRQSTANFIIPEDWLRPGDYVDSWYCSAKAWLRPRGVGRLRGLAVGPLVREERRRQAASIRTMQACLLFRIPMRLKAAGFVPYQIIEWSENQIIDKALVMGCRLAYRGATHNAVQNTPLFQNLLNLFPTALECDLGVTADRVVCSGPLPARVLADQSQGRLVAVEGCGLRYDYLWRIEKKQGRLPSARKQSLDALVALPIELSRALDALHCMIPLFVHRCSVSWYIKAHPGLPAEDLELAVGPQAASRVTFVEGSLVDWLAKVDVLITANSGTALEAAAVGLPVIQIGSPTSLNYDPLHWFSDSIGVKCFSSDEVSAALDRVAALTPDGRSELTRRGREVLEGWFAPVTEEALSRFLAQ